MMPSLEQVVRDLGAVKPGRWRYHGYPTEDDALVKIPFGHLRAILAALAASPTASDTDTAIPGGEDMRTTIANLVAGVCLDYENGVPGIDAADCYRVADDILAASPSPTRILP